MQRAKEKGRRDGGDALKGLAAGIAGGVLGAIVMNQFQSLLGKLIKGEERSHGAQSLQQGAPHRGAGRELEKEGSEDADDDATERLANVLSEKFFDHHLSKSEKALAGTALHYFFGISAGAFYGTMAELAPEVTIAGGLPFGAAVWLTADEGIVPLLGLSKSPAEYPLSTHAYALASHLVFGLTTEVIRRSVRDALD